MKKKTKIILSTLLILVGLGLLGTAGWLWYDANVDRSGWELLEDGSYSYRDFHGKSVTGWLSLEDRTCYFDDDYQHLFLEIIVCYFGTSCRNCQLLYF